jgi:hypothetical protein
MGQALETSGLGDLGVEVVAGPGSLLWEGSRMTISKAVSGPSGAR